MHRLPNNDQIARALSEDFTPPPPPPFASGVRSFARSGQLRLVEPRKPRGYWLEDGDGGKRFLATVKRYGNIPAIIARKLGLSYGNTYAIGLRLKCWIEKPRNNVPQRHDIDRFESQEIDFSDCAMAKFYGYKGNTYASVPSHVSKSGGMK